MGKIYLVQRFNGAAGVTRADIGEFFRTAAGPWNAHYPEQVFRGVWGRMMRVGPRPDYLAMWEIGRAGLIDEWVATAGEFEDLTELMTKFGSITTDNENSLMELL